MRIKKKIKSSTDIKELIYNIFVERNTITAYELCSEIMIKRMK